MSLINLNKSTRAEVPSENKGTPPARARSLFIPAFVPSLIQLSLRLPTGQGRRRRRRRPRRVRLPRS